jgi:hypothetical protein
MGKQGNRVQFPGTSGKHLTGAGIDCACRTFVVDSYNLPNAENRYKCDSCGNVMIGDDKGLRQPTTG